MNYTGQNVIDRTRFTLLDAGAKAWTAGELLAWLNDARSRTFELRPDIFETTADFVCVAGSKQTVPDGSTRLFEVEHNVSHKNKREITLTTDQVLARFRPLWRSMKPANEIEHYLYDEADGGEFEVYPPAINTTSIRISYAKPPAEVTTLATVLTAEGELAAAYVDYLLARAFFKESDTAPEFTQRANNHMALFDLAVSMDARTKLSLSPNTQREGGTPPQASA